MTTSNIRVGILGASRIAPDAIINPAKSIDSINIVGVAASNATRARVFADKHDIPYFTGRYDELVGTEMIDLVYISLTNGMHYEYALKSVKNGKHVLIEKPLCLTHREFEEIEESQKTYNVVAMEALMAEHHPWQRAMPEIIRTRGYGRILKIVSFNNFTLKGRSDFRITSKTGGGAIYDLGCYCLQFVQRLVGLDFKTVSCDSDGYGPNDIDTEFNAFFETTGGVEVEIHCSFKKPFKAHHIVECENGRLEVKNFFRSGFGYNKMKIHCTDPATGQMDIVSFEPMNFYHNQLLDLIEMIRSGDDGTRFVEAGQRVEIMEELHRVRKICRPSSEPAGDAYRFF